MIEMYVAQGADPPWGCPAYRLCVCGKGWAQMHVSGAEAPRGQMSGGDHHFLNIQYIFNIQ